MTTEKNPGKEKLLIRSANVLVNCDKQSAFDFISSGSELSSWLKAVGSVPGVKSVELLGAGFDKPGDQRKVTFENGDSAIEELLSFYPPGNYTYKISHISNFLKKMNNAVYGQCWFDAVEDRTRITWTYSFTYKNFFDGIFVSLFLTFTYKRFMEHSLNNAKSVLEEIMNYPAA